jgi:hypothetical protein
LLRHSRHLRHRHSGLFAVATCNLAREQGAK